MFLELKGEITGIPEGLKVESPDNPTFFYGNFLLLDKAPESTDLKQLETLFKSLFTGPKIKHFTFCWKGKVVKDWSEFLKVGYEYDESSILTLQENELIKPKSLNESIEVRPFSSDNDWNEWIDLETAEREKGDHEEANYRIYLAGKVRMYKQFVKLNRGNYFGAYIDGKLVAAAGLFSKEKIGRFQSVLTKTSYRKQGICKSLMFEICKRYAGDLETLVIAADNHYFAKDIYEQLGFKTREIQSSLCWWEKPENTIKEI